MSKDEAQDALWQAIEATAKESEEYSGTARSEMVRDAALAYRLVAGGAQPGGIVAPKS
jgi:hypothetical protein